MEPLACFVVCYKQRIELMVPSVPTKTLMGVVTCSNSCSPCLPFYCVSLFLSAVFDMPRLSKHYKHLLRAREKKGQLLQHATDENRRDIPIANEVPSLTAVSWRVRSHTPPPPLLAHHHHQLQSSQLLMMQGNLLLILL